MAVVAAPVAARLSSGAISDTCVPITTSRSSSSAEHALDALLAFTRRHRRAEILFRGDQVPEADRKGLPPAFELTWNHTTLRALRQDPAITYLQSLYPFPHQLDLVERIHARFGAEVPAHLEFVRMDGKVTCLGVPLVRFTTEERLDEIVRIHEDMGAAIFNPHRYTLEEGGMKQTDEVQLAFKSETDPRGLLNPGQDDRLGRSGLRLPLRQDLPVSGARRTHGRVSAYAMRAIAARIFSRKAPRCASVATFM